MLNTEDVGIVLFHTVGNDDCAFVVFKNKEYAPLVKPLCHTHQSPPPLTVPLALTITHDGATPKP